MKAGIAVDNWKLPIFRKRLTEAGFIYEDGGDLFGNCTLLMVETDDVERLEKVIRKSNSECRK